LDKRQGSIFNTAGDSILAEFPSAVNAVECAVEFQNKIKERNQSEKTTTKLEYRIGINMGDVVSREGNLLGDGVNIAARLEALCQPNSVCISKSIYDLVVPKTKMTFNDLGVQKVKQNSFHAYDVLLDPSQKRKLKSTQKFGASITIGAVVLVAVVVLAIGVIFIPKNEQNLVDENKFEETSRPIVLVLPIKASGLSEDMKGFENGITESMVSAFSSYKGIRVLSTSTSFYISEQQINDISIRDEYGVKFILRGSMQVMGDNARLNLQVTDTKLNELVATKKRDFKLSEIFAVQDEISEEILGLLQIDLGVGKGAGTWVKNFDTMEDFTVWLNWIRVWRKFSKEGHFEAQDLLDQLKAKYTGEHTFLYVGEAWQLSQRLSMNLSKNPEKDLELLKLTINKGVEFDPESSDVYNARALINLINFNGDCADSLADMKLAEKNGVTQETLHIGAIVYKRCGDIHKAILSLKEVLKLVPNDPSWLQTGNLAEFLFIEGRHQEIIEIIGKKINAEDMSNKVLAIYALLELENGNTDKAKAYFDRSLDNGFTWKRFRSLEEPLMTESLDRLETLIPFERGDKAE
jgi:TolB-like protein